MNTPVIYALDFDGVICDSAVETAITGWKAAGRLWRDMPQEAPQTLVEQFRLLRPVIETGYEAILAMRMLHLDGSAESVYRSYAGKTEALLQETQATVADLKKLFGETRDNWIAGDLHGWLGMNPLFAGIAEKLRLLGQRGAWYVVTTKQERFVKQILKANAIELAQERIFGLDRNMNKQQVLKQLSAIHPAETICFVEDRLPTLLNVMNDKELDGIELVFALWGYNTAEDKALAAQQNFASRRLEDFLQF